MQLYYTYSDILKATNCYMFRYVSAHHQAAVLYRYSAS